LAEKAIHSRSPLRLCSTPRNVQRDLRTQRSALATLVPWPIRLTLWATTMVGSGPPNPAAVAAAGSDGKRIYSAFGKFDTEDIYRRFAELAIEAIKLTESEP
jgi:hypothetical protein